MRSFRNASGHLAVGRGPLVVVALLLGGCGQADLLHVDLITGRLQNPQITEASGIACPGGSANWVLNDGGAAAIVYRIDGQGGDLGEVRVQGATNVDWEDIAIVERAGASELLIADVGDNGGVRDTVSLYLLPLPEPHVDAAIARRRVDVSFPDGARDVEAVAVDNRSETAYLLSKRRIPAELFAVPLAGNEKRVEARPLGPVLSLPRPPADDVRLAPFRHSWYWQPTAMDFSADGDRAVILTYQGIYLFTRSPGAGWHETLNGDSRFFRLPPNATAESACLNGDAIVVTFEGRYAPVYRIPVDADGWSERPVDD